MVCYWWLIYVPICLVCYRSSCNSLGILAPGGIKQCKKAWRAKTFRVTSFPIESKILTIYVRFVNSASNNLPLCSWYLVLHFVNFNYFYLLHSSLFKYYDYLLVIFLHYSIFKIRLLLNQFVSILMVCILRILIIKACKILIKSWILTFVEVCKSRKWKFWNSAFVCIVLQGRKLMMGEL